MRYFFDEDEAVDEAEFLAAKNGIDMAVVETRGMLKVKQLAAAGQDEVIMTARGDPNAGTETSGIHPAG